MNLKYNLIEDFKFFLETLNLNEKDTKNLTRYFQNQNQGMTLRKLIEV